MTAPTIDRPTLTRTRHRPPRTVRPDDAQQAITAGTPLVVDVDKLGSGWWLIEVHADTYRVYRDGRDLYVPHGDVRVRP